MGRRLCQLVEWLNLQKFLWILVLLLSFVGVVYTIIPSVIDLVRGYAPDTAGYIESHARYINLLGSRSDVLRSLFWSALTLSLTFCFAVCPKRRALVRSIATGYWRNFVAPILNETKISLVIVKPGYGMCADTPGYLKAAIARIEQELGVTLEDGFIPEAKRTAMLATKDGVALPLAFDFGRNLVVLGEIITEELAGFLGGWVCTPDAKFAFIRDKVFGHLQQEWLDRIDLGRRVLIVDLDDLEPVRARLATLEARPAPALVPAGGA